MEGFEGDREMRSEALLS